MVVSDNGSSAEGGPNGSFNENKFFNNVADSVEANLERLDELGAPSSYNHYNTGWAWAFDTPFPYWKRFAGYEGGVADILLVSWPKGIDASGDVRDQYVHAVDLVPTTYDMLGIEPPEVLKGYTQSAIEGESFAPSFSDPSADGRETQFYSMLGMRSLYHQGWLANTLHPPISGWGKFHLDEWELYNLAEDRSQLHNLAGDHPEKLDELKGLWWYYAGIYKGLPLDDRTALEIISDVRPQPSEPRDRYVYYPGAAEVTESVSVNVRRRSFTIAAAVDLKTPEAEGVLFSQGARAGGHALYLKDGRLHYTYNWLGEKEQTVSSDAEVPSGSHVLTAEFQKTGDDEKHDERHRNSGALHRHRRGWQRQSHDPARDVRPERRRGVRRARQRLLRLLRLRGAVPLCRRHDRPCGYRRQRRPLRRSREGSARLPGARLGLVRAASGPRAPVRGPAEAGPV